MIGGIRIANRVDRRSSSCTTASRFLQQYKSRKRQKREARITEGIANAASSAVVVGHDLDKPAGRRPVPTPRTKGSRFTHSEKLQFTKVTQFSSRYSVMVTRGSTVGCFCTRQ